MILPPTRRHILAGVGAALAVPLPARPAATAAGDRVILLGTKGGPTPSPFRAAPATVLVIAGRAYLVDCGNGVAGQLVKAGIALPSLAQVFITHDHSDHVIDAATLMVLAWASGLATPVTLHGPPPLARIVADGLDAASYDIAARIREEGRTPLVPLVKVDERSTGGVVFENADVRVTATLVDHYSVKPAFAYRFDTAARSVVISGDTAPSDNLVALARGADLLIHEAIYAAAIPRMAGENAPTLADHLRRSHTTTEQLGVIAARAGVRKLMLSHLVPAWPEITDAMWLAGVRRSFHGEAVVGRDLMQV